MKSTRTTALAAIGIAVTLSLTACGETDSGNNASSANSSSSSASDRDAKTEDGSKSGGSEARKVKSNSGEDVNAGAPNGATKDNHKVPFCKTGDLAVEAVDAAPDENAGRINITMVNEGSATCSATGFPKVYIKDADNTSSPIGRGDAEPRVTTLKPGDAAVFNLAYDIDNSGDSLASPTDILVTPPNETQSVSVKWPADAGEIKGAYTDVDVYPTHTTK